MNAIEMSKQIFTLMRAILVKRIAGCVDCGGSGDLELNCDMGDTIVTCPTCADWRELVKKLCKGKPCCSKPASIRHCGFGAVQCIDCESYLIGNPNLTTHMTGSRLTLVDMLDRMGLWENAIGDIWEKLFYPKVDEFSTNDLDEIYSDILTDGKYLVEAVHSFLKEEMEDKG